MHFTVIGTIIDRDGCRTDVTLLVAAAIDNMHFTAPDFCTGDTRAVTIVGLSVFFCRGIRACVIHRLIRVSLCTSSFPRVSKVCIVIVTHVGTRIKILLPV